MPISHQLLQEITEQARKDLGPWQTVHELLDGARRNFPEDRRIPMFVCWIGESGDVIASTNCLVKHPAYSKILLEMLLVWGNFMRERLDE